MDPARRLQPDEERAHYETHENDPSDSRYRRFLSQLSLPLAARLQVGAEGLDYGCGPGPALSRMLEEQGFVMTCYDPFFNAQPDALEREYDFVACSEAAEHFFFPALEFERFNRLLRPGGLLAVMTEMLQEGVLLHQWRYARDPTHVCFYRKITMVWIARRYGWALEFPNERVALFEKG